MAGDAYFQQAKQEFLGLRISQALRLFTLAEQAGCDRDLCSAERWTCHMLMGDFELAWRESDAISARSKPDRNRFWDGRPLDGRSILMRCLHGLGDTIQFVRYAPIIREKAKTLTIEVQPSLKTLFQQASIAGQVITWGDPEPYWDQQIEIVEIPRIFRTTLASIPDRVPYIDVPVAPLIPEYDGTRYFRVGLVWASGSYNPARSVPLDYLAELFSVPGVAFFSLQGGFECRQLASYTECIVDLQEESVSVFAAAKTLKNLDLVISVDTMIAHLAGAMGRRVWTFLPYECDWRWMLDREDSPWYPSMRLLRQPRPGDWQPLIRRVKADLEACVRAGRLDPASREAPEQCLAREA